MRISQRRFCRKYTESYEYLHFKNQSHYVNYWTPEQMHVLDVRPGITAPACIKFRNENELMEKAADPEDYYIHVIMQEKIKLYSFIITSNVLKISLMSYQKLAFLHTQDRV